MNCPWASITPNARRLSPTVNVWPARPTSGPPCMESAICCRLRPSAAGKSDAAGAEAPCTFSRRPPDSGRLAVPSPPPLSDEAQPATARTAAITAMMEGRRRIAMSLETHTHGAHEHHHHTVAPDADRKRLAAALALIVAFMLAEVVAGVVAGSIALLSDAAHMLTDAASLTLALVAARLAQRPLHVRARPRRGALRAGQRRGAAAPRRRDRDRGGAALELAARGRRRDRAGGRAARCGGQRRGRLAAREGRAPLAERRGRPRPRADGPLRVARRRGGRRDRAAHGLPGGRSGGGPAGRRADGPFGLARAA